MLQAGLAQAHEPKAENDGEEKRPTMKQFEDSLLWLELNFRHAEVKVQHLSDILRYLLIVTYGGVWVDATSIFLEDIRSKIDGWIANTNSIATGQSIDVIVPSKLSIPDIFQGFFG